MSTDTTQQEREALLPCPFCGSTAVSVWMDHRVVCGGCDAEGPSLHDAAEANINGWNARATPQGAEPVAEGKAFDAFLCRAWGETELTSAEIVQGWDGVRRFMVREWLGEEDATNGDGGNTLDQLKADFDEHEEDGRGGTYTLGFEIGGVSVERVYSFHPPEPKLSELRADAKDAARWRMLPAFFEEYQIDALKLYRDIDAELARQEGSAT